MNLTFKASWIIFLNLSLIGLLLFQLFNYNYITKQGFTNYPQQIDPTKPIKSDPDTDEANQNYVQILYYLSKNPMKSTRFIEDIRTKFFNPSCSIKSDIDFAGLMNNNKLVF